MSFKTTFEDAAMAAHHFQVDGADATYTHTPTADAQWRNCLTTVLSGLSLFFDGDREIEIDETGSTTVEDLTIKINRRVTFNMTRAITAQDITAVGGAAEPT